MQDFDDNDDLRLPGAGQGGSSEHPDRSEIGQRPLRVRRVRQQRAGHTFDRFSGSSARSEISPLARQRHDARSACPFGGRALLVEAPSRLSRRLWAMCHGQPPGSRS